MGGELAEDWCVEDPNEEWYNPTGGPKGTWMPEGHVILELLERIQKEKVFELKWKCPGRRPPPSAEVEEEMEVAEETEEEDWAEEQQEDKSAAFGEFDFDDAPSEMSTKITPRRTPGTGKSPRPQKRVARMDDVLNKIMTQRRQSEAARASKGLGVRGRRTPIYSSGSPRSRFVASPFKAKPSPFQLHKTSPHLKSPTMPSKSVPKSPASAVPMETDINTDKYMTKTPTETQQLRQNVPSCTAMPENVVTSKTVMSAVSESRVSVYETSSVPASVLPSLASPVASTTTTTTAAPTPKPNPVSARQETPVEHREPIPKLLLKIPPKSANQPATSMILPPGHSRASFNAQNKKSPPSQAFAHQGSHGFKPQGQTPSQHPNAPKTPPAYGSNQMYQAAAKRPPVYQGPPKTPPVQHKANTPPTLHSTAHPPQPQQQTHQPPTLSQGHLHSGPRPPTSMHAAHSGSSNAQVGTSPEATTTLKSGGQNISPTASSGAKTPPLSAGGPKTPPFMAAHPAVSTGPKTPPLMGGGPKMPPLMGVPQSSSGGPKTPPVMARNLNIPPSLTSGPQAAPGMGGAPLSHPSLGIGPRASPTVGSGPKTPLSGSGPHMPPSLSVHPKTPPALGTIPKAHVNLQGRSKTPPANLSGQRTPPAFISGPKTPPAYAHAAKTNPFFQQQMLQSLANAHNQRTGAGNQGLPPSSSPQRLHSPQGPQWAAPGSQYPPRSAPSPSQHPPQRSVTSPGQQFSPRSMPSSPNSVYPPHSLPSTMGSPRGPHGQIIHSPPRSTPQSPHSAGPPPRSPFHLNFPLPGLDQGQIKAAIQQQQQHVLQQHALQLQKQQKLQQQQLQQQHGQPRPKTPPAYPGTIARPQFPPTGPPMNPSSNPLASRPTPHPRFPLGETSPMGLASQQRTVPPISHGTPSAQPNLQAAHLSQSSTLHQSQQLVAGNQSVSQSVTDPKQP